MISLSAVIISFNEERNIRRCLKSIGDIADEILVVDSFSSDKTRDICREFNVRFVEHAFESHIQQKNWALNEAKYDYVLSLDADEELSPELRESIRKTKNNWIADAYTMSRKTSYTNSRDPRDVRFAERKIRLWDRRKGAWGGFNPHDTVIIDADSKLDHMKGDMLHYSYFSIEAHKKKADYFSTIAANALFTAGRRSDWLRIIFSPAWKFFRAYFLRLGFLDGVHGFLISASSAHGTYLKYRKLKKYNSGKHLNIPESVCFFNTNKKWGGGEKWSLSVACELKKRGYNVFVVAYRGSELLRRVRKESISAVGLKMRNSSLADPFLMLRIRRIYQANNVSTVFLNLSIDLKTGGAVAGKTGVKNIIYRRALANPIRNNRRNRKLLTRVVSKIVVTSIDSGNGALSNLNNILDYSKIVQVYNGVELPELDGVKSINDKLILGSAGRLSAEKRFIKLVEVAKLLKSKNILFEVHLAGEGDQLALLEQAVHKEGLEEEFKFLGFIKDMDQFYRSINLFLLTSEKEGFANVLLEAMSYAVPVLAFDIGSPSELVGDGEDGFIIPDSNTELMAERIAELHQNRDLMARFSRNAREKIEGKYSFDKHISKVEELIR